MIGDWYSGPRHYGVFWNEDGDKAMWARARRKRDAVRHAKRHGGYVVAVGYGFNGAWDAPTFKVSGDIIADYR